MHAQAPFKQHFSFTFKAPADGWYLSSWHWPCFSNAADSDETAPLLLKQLGDGGTLLTCRHAES